jgi:hypothetical protein
MLALLSSISNGCASPDVRPFQEFERAVGELRSGVDAAIAFNADWTYDSFLDRAVDASRPVPPGQRADDAAIQFIKNMRFKPDRNDPLVPRQRNPHVFLQILSFRTGVDQFNAAFLQYAQLLEQLASPELVPDARLDDLARDINGNARSALNAFGVDADASSLAAFSVAARGGLRGWLEHRRRARLAQTLDENQEAVEDFANKGVEAVVLSGNIFASAYDERSQVLLNQIVATAGDQARRAKIEELVELNQLYMQREELVRSLRRSYAVLPDVHRRLRGALRGELDLGAIRELFAEGRRLKGLADELAGSSGGEKADEDRAKGQGRDLAPAAGSKGGVAGPGDRPHDAGAAGSGEERSGGD